jgi:hypothetical protein
VAPSKHGRQKTDDGRRDLTTNQHSAASGFALGRNQKVRLTEKLHKMLHIKMLRTAKIKIEHKKQRFERLYYE